MEASSGGAEGGVNYCNCGCCLGGEEKQSVSVKCHRSPGSPLAASKIGTIFLENHPNQLTSSSNPGLYEQLLQYRLHGGL